jgi:hypothetical protein
VESIRRAIPKDEAAKLKESADKLKAMIKTALKELKSDYESWPN